ncbi:hypothetical protein [Cryobacterium luteum]|uniref:Uncharacterized protein n=1 Tax=Cryobacterium luteum TaxID=1424661 RepID=A0A1H8GMR0_9MICO|nr:hypothetical protein [Cryobacterium luteum]TFB84654.1 hypothetical protein E3O10_16180 [Cryobacterium luteum]SEN45075.1 hypothetical protein SAMN05216281_1089 [Cryobacterium luteum]
MSTHNEATESNQATDYYEFGGGWVHESKHGDDVVKKQYTADPRISSSHARLDHSTRIFPNGSWQTTWYDADGVATVDTIES